MANLKKHTDRDLIEMLKWSNHNAYTEIFRRYHILLLLHAYKKLRNEEIAKDIVQDLFVNLWCKRGQILPTNNLALFLFVTLKNKIIDHFLHSDVESKYIAFLASNIDETRISATDHLIREKQLASHIESQIQKLPKKMRKAFKLSKIDHLSNAEIAEALDTTETNVSQHVNNAIRLLKVKLRPLIVWIIVMSVGLYSFLL